MRIAGQGSARLLPVLRAAKRISVCTGGLSGHAELAKILIRDAFRMWLGLAVLETVALVCSIAQTTSAKQLLCSCLIRRPGGRHKGTQKTRRKESRMLKRQNRPPAATLEAQPAWLRRPLATSGAKAGIPDSGLQPVACPSHT